MIGAVEVLSRLFGKRGRGLALPKGHLARLGRWYYYIDFGDGLVTRPDLRDHPSRGQAHWNRFLQYYLPSPYGQRILDIGCNAGLYALKMAEAGAALVVGVDRYVRQAEFVRERLAPAEIRERLRFVQADVRHFPLRTLGAFDMVCLFRVAYHLGRSADLVMRQLSEMTPLVVMQGNARRLSHMKYRRRPFQDLAGVEGMAGLLRRHGFTDLTVVAPPDHAYPLVLGRRRDWPA
jgi:SAM-dependent methyltransferase